MALGHPWKVSYEEALRIQREVAALADTASPLGDVRLVAGADLSSRRQRGDVVAAVVLCDIDGNPIEQVTVAGETDFPYVPGLLSFREAPLILRCLERLSRRPDVLILDGHGICHPRRAGLATHVGVAAGIPAVGCAKRPFVGVCEEPADERGARTPLLLEGEVVGAALRTRPGVKPVYVSPGHRCDVESAAALVLRLATRYRLPEPTRLAHAAVLRAVRGR